VIRKPLLTGTLEAGALPGEQMPNQHDQKRARELDVPLEPRDIQIRTFAGRLMVKVAWMAPVKLLDRAISLNFSLEKEQKLPE